MEKLRIVFMGTPQFAVGILDAILKNNYEVVGVITAADKPAGRGQKLQFSAVKEYAISNSLKLLQTTNLKDEKFLNELKSLNANVQVIVAFRMLPQVVWQMPTLGTFNLHASLLPNYRGAAPINWAIINGESQTGVTTFYIDDKIDTGQMILSKSVPILVSENAGQLHDKLMHLGCETVLETLILIEAQKVKTTIQVESDTIKTAHKLNRENCKIDWNKSSTDIFNLIRGLSPYPAAWCTFIDEQNQWNIKIYEATFEINKHNLSIGAVFSTKKELKIAVSNGFIVILTLQFPGKKKMTTPELLNGMNFSDKTIAI